MNSNISNENQNSFELAFRNSDTYLTDLAFNLALTSVNKTASFLKFWITVQEHDFHHFRFLWNDLYGQLLSNHY